MNRVHSLILGLIFLGSIGKLSAGEPDSLRTLISAATHDGERAGYWMQLGNYYENYLNDSALICYKISHELYSRLPDFGGAMDNWYFQARFFNNTHDSDSAEFYLNLMYDQVLTHGDTLRLGNAHYQYGLMNQFRGNLDLAISHFHKSIELYTTQNYQHGIGGSYNYLVLIFRDKGLLDSASYYFINSLKIFGDLGHETNTAIIKNNLGDLCMQNGQYDMAGQYFRESLSIHERYADHVVYRALVLNNLGRMYSELENYPEAEAYYLRSMEESASIDNLRGVLDIYNNLGDLYNRQQRYPEALDFFTRAYEGFTGMDFYPGVVITLGNIAGVYATIGQVSKAIEINDSLLSMVVYYGNPDLIMDAYENVYINYVKMGDYRKAIDYLILRDSVRAEIYNVEKARAMADLLLKYEKEKDQARILALEGQNLRRTIQRNGFLYGSIGLGILFVFSFLYLRQKQLKDRIITVQQIRQLEEEKKLMVARMIVEGQEEERKRIARELHDGLGVLLSATKMQFTSLRNVSPENGHIIDKATQLLEQASGDVRKISHNMMPGLLTKLGLYEAVEDLFENLNDMENLVAVVEIVGVQERLPENKEIMLYRVIQEMVNNTLKHARATEIRLRMQIAPESISVVYSDNGIGFDPQTALSPDTESLGLKSIQSRVGFLGGRVEIESGPGAGSTFSLEIPV